MSKTRAMPTKATPDMIAAAYMLIETMPKGTDERHKRIVEAVWDAMASCTPRSKTLGLTLLQSRVHEIIAEFIDDHGRAPEYVEIGEQIRKDKGEVCRIVQALKRRGAVDFKPHTKRSLVLLVQPGEPLKRGNDNDKK